MSTEIPDSNENKKSFGETLHDLRKNAGLTQTQLSELTGITQSHISSLETGKWRPRFNTVIVLSKVFDVPLDTFKDLPNNAPEEPLLESASLEGSKPTFSANVPADISGNSMIPMPDETSILVKRGVEAGLAAKSAANILGLPKPQILTAQATAVGRATVPDAVTPDRHAAR